MQAIPRNAQPMPMDTVLPQLLSSLMKDVPARQEQDKSRVHFRQGVAKGEQAWISPCHAGRCCCFVPLIQLRWGQYLLTTCSQALVRGGEGHRVVLPPHQMGQVLQKGSKPSSVTPVAFQAGNRAELKADKISKRISIGMKTRGVQISFCIGHSCKSSGAQVPCRWVSLLLPDVSMPNTQGIMEHSCLCCEAQQFHKAENYSDAMAAKTSSLSPPQKTKHLNTAHKITP